MGGHGWVGWQGFVGYLGVRPVPSWASISLVAELGGGLALVGGLLVLLAAAGLVAQSLGLDWLVLRPKGFWTSNGGIEFPLAFGGGAFALQVPMPGSWSLYSMLPALDVLYEPAVRWTILGVALLGALLANRQSATRPAAAHAGGWWAEDNC